MKKPIAYKPPAGLSAEARARWREMIREYALDDAAGLLLLRTALEAMDRMRGAQASIAADGATIKDRFGQTKAHPAIVTERDARSAMMTALKSLNLDLEPLRDRPGRPAGGSH